MKNFALIFLFATTGLLSVPSVSLDSPLEVAIAKPLTVKHSISGSLTKKMVIGIHNTGNYASLSLYVNQQLLIEELNVPKAGDQVLNALVRFQSTGDLELTFKAKDANLLIKSLAFENFSELDIPHYKDISRAAGLDKVSSIKYGGPTVADIDNDGDYDFILNNHNEESSKLYWNEGNGTVRKHDKDLSRWFMHDLHGTAAGDYDNDGDLDIVVTQGGGNGEHPSKTNFYKNENGKLILATGDVKIDRGGRGRGAKWLDADLDGDLDLMLFNEASLSGDKPQHFFYENLGDGTFRFKEVSGLQDVHPSRVLLTDFNGDNIDDVILYGPLSLWQGNGDFTFTDVTGQIPKSIAGLKQIMAVADLDIDNDGDLDLYLARGKMFEHGYGESPSMDFDPISQEFAIKPRGYKGVDEFDFRAGQKIRLHGYDYLAQGKYRGKDYPLFLGRYKSVIVPAPGDEVDIHSDMAEGWPQDLSDNGVYFGYLGDGRWRAALVRGGDMFWSFKFSLSGVYDVSPKFIPQNRNEADVLLRNDGGKFSDVSREWNIQPGSNSLGVTVGDFNNDSHEDIFLYRWGRIDGRLSDYMLLNTGKGHFETLTMHGAADSGGPGYGDMGQAFDFDLDGDLDLLNGSEAGEWYLYSNEKPGGGNYALVKVGYAPISRIDAISAEVILETRSKKYRKRVGSSGAVFSQSLLNIVHFGLGAEEKIDKVTVRWRNGERVTFTDKAANTMLDTDRVDPTSLTIVPSVAEIRKDTSSQMIASLSPVNANKSLRWSTSDESVLTISQDGLVTAVGEVNQTATVTALCKITGLSSSSRVKIVESFVIPIRDLLLSSRSTQMFEGERLALKATVVPEHADDISLAWLSSDSSIASVDANGEVTAIEAGKVIISALSKANNAVRDQIEISVKPLVEPYIRIVDEDKIAKTNYVVGDSITVKVNYHAGSGNHVIASDEGGVRIWLRHFKHKWIPEKDIILTDSSVLNTESGSSSMTISLKGLTPTAKLAEGHFYYLRASFTSSDGQVHEQGIYPIQIVDPN